jgi:stalled ribosome rescue protein Dom34
MPRAITWEGCLRKSTIHEGKGWMNIMLYNIVIDFPNAIIFEEEGPCISLYQPTHRYPPENNQDPIVFKNLINEVEKSLKQKYSKKDINTIMKPFYQIKDDQSFWNNALEGLAILANPNKCIVYKFHRPVKELAIVADSFHIMPLISAFQSVEKYQLLALSRNEFSLYQGNRYGFEEIEIDSDIPRTIEEVLGDELTDPHLSHKSHGSVSKSAMYHGHGGKSEETDKDTEKFFRYVDLFVLENYSKSSELPLILVSLKEYHSLFNKISRNSYLVAKGISHSYDSLDVEKLKEKALEIIESNYLEKTKNLSDSFETAKANALGTDNLKQVAKAAFENRVETVLIEDEKIMPGKIDHNTGEIKLGDIQDPDYDDILDDLAELVLKNGGAVVALPKERMPSDTGVAAIYRYR